MKYESNFIIITPCHLESSHIITQNIQSVENQINCDISFEQNLIFDGIEPVKINLNKYKK